MGDELRVSGQDCTRLRVSLGTSLEDIDDVTSMRGKRGSTYLAWAFTSCFLCWDPFTASVTGLILKLGCLVPCWCRAVFCCVVWFLAGWFLPWCLAWLCPVLLWLWFWLLDLSVVEAALEVVDRAFFGRTWHSWNNYIDK